MNNVGQIQNIDISQLCEHVGHELFRDLGPNHAFEHLVPRIVKALVFQATYQPLIAQLQSHRLLPEVQPPSVRGARILESDYRCGLPPQAFYETMYYNVLTERDIKALLNGVCHHTLNVTDNRNIRNVMAELGVDRNFLLKGVRTSSGASFNGAINVNDLASMEITIHPGGIGRMPYLRSLLLGAGLDDAFRRIRVDNVEIANHGNMIIHYTDTFHERILVTPDPLGYVISMLNSFSDTLDEVMFSFLSFIAGSGWDVWSITESLPNLLTFTRLDDYRILEWKRKELAIPWWITQSLIHGRQYNQ